MMAQTLCKMVNPAPCLDTSGIQRGVESIIHDFPCRLKYRQERHYDPQEALQFLTEISTNFREMMLTDELGSDFAERGMGNIYQRFSQLYSLHGSFMGVYTCPPYSVLIGKIDGKLLLVDTHPVPESSGGN